MTEGPLQSQEREVELLVRERSWVDWFLLAFILVLGNGILTLIVDIVFLIWRHLA